jgi:hypothetical protein
MRNASSLMLFFLILVLGIFSPSTAFSQDKVRIGVPLFPTVSYPVFIAHEKGFFEKNGLKAEIIRINSEPTTYQALIPATSMRLPARPPVSCNRIYRACRSCRWVVGTISSRTPWQHGKKSTTFRS